MSTLKAMTKVMEKINWYYKTANQFFLHDLWRLDFTQLSGLKRRLVRHSKVLVLTLRNFLDLRVGREAVSLSFFCTMAIVPFVAAILFITGGLGLENNLSDALHSAFPTSVQMIDYVLDAAGKIVASLENGLFGIISFISFIWLVFWLMLNIEQSFNRIWKVDKARQIWKRFIVYVVILLLAPLLLLVFCYGSFYYTTFSNALQSRLGLFDFLTSWMYWLVFYALSVVVMSLIYKFIPHAKVKYVPCFKAAIISSFAFVGIQYIYIETQMMVTRIGAVYGMFAAIPLFMVWMNLCWQIILFGSELSYGFQKVYDYDLEKETWLQQVL